MTPYHSDPWLTVYQGDCREVLASMEPESVHCVVTSPPYWGLRDYGTTGQLGLEPTPEEYVANMVDVFREVRRVLRADGTVWLNLGASFAGGDRTTGRNDAVRQGKQTGGGFEAGPRTKIAGAGASGRSRSRQPERAPAYDTDGTGPLGSPDPGSAYHDLCDGCLAAGLSIRTTDTLQPHPEAASPDEQTDRDTGPAGSAPASPDASPPDALASTTTRSSTPPRESCSHCGNCGACLSVLRSSSRDAQECVRSSWLNYPTFKPKDMVPIPWLVALALQADGWYLRSDIIWSKPNPMPESVTDRPTKSHEYLFLLTKSPRYFFDADAVRESLSESTERIHGSDRVVPRYDERKVDHVGNGHAGLVNGPERLAKMQAAGGRNIRSVWTVATQPYPGAHFATFPEKLIEPCIKAGSSERGVCPECGAPWVRVVEREPAVVRAPSSQYGHGARRNDGGRSALVGASATTLGWRPSCGHGTMAEAITHSMRTEPAVVLDPFAGSGTTGRVAQRLSRRAVLIDLNADYLVQAMGRNSDIPLGLEAS